MNRARFNFYDVSMHSAIVKYLVYISSLCHFNFSIYNNFDYYGSYNYYISLTTTIVNLLFSNL